MLCQNNSLAKDHSQLLLHQKGGCKLAYLDLQARQCTVFELPPALSISSVSTVSPGVWMLTSDNEGAKTVHCAALDIATTQLQLQAVEETTDSQESWPFSYGISGAADPMLFDEVGDTMAGAAMHLSANAAGEALAETICGLPTDLQQVLNGQWEAAAYRVPLDDQMEPRPPAPGS